MRRRFLSARPGVSAAPFASLSELKEAAAVVDTMEFGPTDPIKEDMWCAVLSLPLSHDRRL